MGKLLLVEDEAPIRTLMRMALTTAGYAALEMSDGRALIETLEQGGIDLILLDVMLPGEDGFTLLDKIRRYQVPVIFVSARSQLADKVQALQAGADDYITKPFGTSELLARLRTAIRHTRTTSGNASIAKENRFIARGLVIDYDKYRVYIDGRDAGLTQNEFKLVALLGRYAGRVLTYDYLIREIWGPNKAYDNQILRVNMANIRRKIEKNPAEPEYIFTEVGVGYRMIEGD